MNRDRARPEAWVIVVDGMSHDQAVALGKAMGGMGLTGQFLAGGLARNMQRFSKWQREHGDQRGGEA